MAGRDNHRGRRPAVWTPGDTLAIDWGSTGCLHVFCAVLAWSRVPVRAVRRRREVRDDAGDAGGVLRGAGRGAEDGAGGPDGLPESRRGRQRGGARPPDYVRFATHYGFRPDFCEAADPESKGIVENLVGYAKRDLIVPQARVHRPGRGEPVAAAWCAEVNARGALGDLRGPGGAAGCTSGTCSAGCRRCARRSAGRREPQGGQAVVRPVRVGPLLGAHAAHRQHVAVTESAGRLLVLEPFTGEIVAEHALVAPGEASIADEHYGGPAGQAAPRAAPKTAAEKPFLALGDAAAAFLTGAAAAGNHEPGPRDLDEILPCTPRTAMRR